MVAGSRENDFIDKAGPCQPGKIVHPSNNSVSEWDLIVDQTA